jgi:uncharacterized coiled-coil protein SlyX
MARNGLDVYLNDHVAGSTMGLDLARRLASQVEGALGQVMAGIADEIERDRETLERLMDRVGTSQNPVKQGITWMAEKASRLKFSGATTGDRELGTLLALETLSLGVEGKRCLWESLALIPDADPAIQELDLSELTARAASQRATIDRERLALVPKALVGREAGAPA